MLWPRCNDVLVAILDPHTEARPHSRPSQEAAFSVARLQLASAIGFTVMACIRMTDIGMA